MIALLNPQTQGTDHREFIANTIVLIVKQLAILHMSVLIYLHLAELIWTLIGGIPWKDEIYMFL